MGCCCSKPDKWNLHVQVECATDIPDMDAHLGKKTADPYVELHYGKEECCWNCCLCWSCCFKSKGWVRTEVKKDELNPIWNEWFTFRDIESLDEPIIINLKDYDKLTADDTMFSKEILRKFAKEEIQELEISEQVKNKNVKLKLKTYVTKRDQPPQLDAKGGKSDSKGNR